MKASNGYSMLGVGAPPRKGKPSSVTLFVIGRRGGAIYSTAAAVTETSMEADLGALGEIAVTFRPSGRPRTVRSRCGGEPVTFDSGFYEGTIAFHGEEEYAAVEAARARGALGFLLALFCTGSSGSIGSPFLPGAQLDVYADGRASPHLKVVKNGPAARAHFEAGLSEVRDGISVSRYVGLTGSSHTFDYDADLQAATVRPPTPFSGTARFWRASPANRWTGDLSVDFPGRANVSLIGTRARTKLVRAHWDWYR